MNLIFHLYRRMYLHFDIPIYIGIICLILNIRSISSSARHRHFIYFDKIELPPCHPLTVSEAQSRSILYRNSLTFIWCMLGFTLTYKKIALHNNPADYIHYSLPLLSIFPLKANVKSEIVLFWHMSSHVCNLIHYCIVVCYITIYPLYKGDAAHLFIAALSFILYALIHVRHTHTLLVETYTIAIITLIFTHT